MSDFWRISRVQPVYVKKDGHVVLVTLQVDARPVQIYLTSDEARQLADQVIRAAETADSRRRTDMGE